MTEFTEVEKIMNNSLAIVTLGMMMVIFITTSDYYPDLYLPNFIRVFSYPQLVPGKWFFWTTPSHLLFFFAIAFTVTVTLDPDSPGWKYLVYTCLIFIGFFIVVRMKNFFYILLVLILLILEKIIYKKWIETGTGGKTWLWIHRILFLVIIAIIVCGYLLAPFPAFEKDRDLLLKIDRLEKNLPVALRIQRLEQLLGIQPTQSSPSRLQSTQKRIQILETEFNKKE
jgi:hypothetical protein